MQRFNRLLRTREVESSLTVDHRQDRPFASSRNSTALGILQPSRARLRLDVGTGSSHTRLTSHLPRTTSWLRRTLPRLEVQHLGWRPASRVGRRQCAKAGTNVQGCDSDILQLELLATRRFHYMIQMQPQVNLSMPVWRLALPQENIRLASPRVAR